jgi:hypothetical protein
MSNLEELIRVYINVAECSGEIDPDDQLIAAARAEQAELIAALRSFADLCDGDLSSVGSGTVMGFDGRLTAGMLKNAKALLSRFPNPETAAKRLSDADLELIATDREPME